ncbi:hypothetical protein B484DRAFT_406342 [Ochromonadaceae sp. CCMP2298]|nr:hypothetical protein B484DRAFT_406342 [Ochromonadaceae sp. CCMP2298]
MSKGKTGRTLGGKGTKACADLKKRAPTTPDNTQGSRVSGRLDKKRRKDAGIEEETEAEVGVEVEEEINEDEMETVGQHTPVSAAEPDPLASGGTDSPLNMFRFVAEQAKLVEQMAQKRAEKDMYHGAPGIDKRAEEANEASYQATQVLLEGQQQQQHQQQYEQQREADRIKQVADKLSLSIDMLEARLEPGNLEGFSEEALNVSYSAHMSIRESFNSYFDGKPPTIKSTTTHIAVTRELLARKYVTRNYPDYWVNKWLAW